MRRASASGAGAGHDQRVRLEAAPRVDDLVARTGHQVHQHRDDLGGSAAEHDVLRLHAVALGQPFDHGPAAHVRVAVHAAGGLAGDGLDHAGQRFEGVLVAGQLERALAGLGRRRAHIVNRRVHGVKGKLLSLRQRLAHSLVPGVPGCINRSRQIHGVSRMERIGKLLRQRQRNMLFHQITSVLWRVTWQLILTAQGIPAIWVGSVSMFTARAVVRPPKPWGPMPSSLIFSSISVSKSA